ncbi:hypothetical protein GOV14_06445 [Candidatus Pacearchaeota archaeon]|nr:hypothetical protein [Candidatus Pacearchaeota archaeon]
MAKTTLVGQVESQFEPISNQITETGSLAKYVSDSLMDKTPRISPELFGLSRKANLNLTPEQEGHICNEYLGHYSPAFTYRISREDFKYAFLDSTKISVDAKIPYFAYAILPDNKEVIFSKSAIITALDKFDISTSNRDHPFKEYTDLVISHNNHSSSFSGLIEDKDIDGKNLKKYSFPSKSYGNVSLDVNAKWTAPFKLDVLTKVPEIPESFIALGDEAISAYYTALKNAPKKLRQKTSLISPRIGVLWVPSNASLCCVGKIPKAKSPPRIKGDPILVLDIPDKDKSHKHAIAAWNIDEELPFKYWITEFSEGALGNIK